MKRPVLLALCGLLLPAAAARTFNAIWPETHCAFWPSINTVYAPDFRPEAFARAKVGMSPDEIRQLLGEPLNVSRASHHPWEMWDYSGKSASWLRGDWAWKYRAVEFKNGVAIKVWSNTQYW